MRISLQNNVLRTNDQLAQELRKQCTAAKTLVLNLTSAPGSGKTALLEASIPLLAPLRAAVIVGDLQTTRDADRIFAVTKQVEQINTEGGCHLSANQVEKAFQKLSLEKIDVLFIENVGNMVCPAGYDLGEHLRVAMVSAPEGEDKVAKYPTLFQPADAVILSKHDLWQPLNFDPQMTHDDLNKLNTAPRFTLSAHSGFGMREWIEWIRSKFSKI